MKMFLYTLSEYSLFDVSHSKLMMMVFTLAGRATLFNHQSETEVFFHDPVLCCSLRTTAL